LKFFNRLYDREAVNEICKLFQARLYLITCSNISNIPYNLICTAKFNDSSILITIISCDYLNLSLVNEYVDDITIPTQVIKYNQTFVQADQPIKLQYSNQIEL
jgi:serine kinase of HPr protein (carbohydrate metabolism regulator)